MNVATGSTHIGRVAFVILHVARTLEVREVVLTFELREQIGRRLAEHVYEHIQPAAMRHADDQLLNTALARALDQIVEHRDQRLAPFEREPLLTDEPRVQVALDAFGAREAREEGRLLLRRERRMHAARFELLAQPQALARSRDVRELGRQLAAVDALQQRQDVLQLHALVTGAGQAAGGELARQIGLVEAQEIEAQDRGRRPLPQPERVEVRDLMAAQAIDLDQPRDRRLLLDRGRIAVSGRNGRSGYRCALLCPAGHRPDDGAMGYVAAILGERAEILTPLRRHTARFGEKLLIEPFDIGRIGSLQRRRLVLFLEYCAHGPGLGGAQANELAASESESARSVAKR